MWIRLIALALVLAVAPHSSAEPGFVVIVNASNKARVLERRVVTDMFLKKRTQWSGNDMILPVDQSRGAAVRRQFSEQVLGRSVAEVRTYWNRLVFSGRGVPPPELANDDDVVKYVGKHGGAIGYVASSVKLGTDVRVVEVR